VTYRLSVASTSIYDLSPSPLPRTPIDPYALIRSVCDPTPTLQTRLLDGREIFLKREDLGPNGAFKWRGALVACSKLKDDGATAIVTASTGNHGAAAAWSASRVGLSAHVVVPVGAVERKCEMIARHGAELHYLGDTLEEAVEHARQLAGDNGAVFLEDGASAAQLAGTATIGTEILEGLEGVDTVITPLACGALAGGLATALKGAEQPPHVVGVQSIHFSRIAALFHDYPYQPTGGSTFADGLADDRIVEPSFSACMEHLDDVVTVEEEELEDGVRRLWEAAGVRVEGAGAAPLAGLLRYSDRIPGKRVVLLISGANLGEADAERIFGTATAP
jgi:threonine dehydratase